MPSILRGEQIHKVCYAKNNKQAIEIFECSLYYLTNYSYKNEVHIDSFTILAQSESKLYAFFDSGILIDKYANLKNVEMPIIELKALIDLELQNKYNEKKIIPLTHKGNK